MTTTYYKRVDPELENAKYRMTCNQNNGSREISHKKMWLEKLFHCSSQSEAASRQHQGGHYLDEEGTAGVHLLAITISDRNQGDILEKEGTGRRALAELDDLSGLTHFT